MKPRPESTYTDLTGRVIGFARVLGRAGNSPPPQSRPLWSVLCDPELGGCGRTRVVTGQLIREGRVTRCKRCRGREHAARQQADGHIERLHTPLWPRVCGTCGVEFRGTARQKFCCREHRPSFAGKAT